MDREYRKTDKTSGVGFMNFKAGVYKVSKPIWRIFVAFPLTLSQWKIREHHPHSPRAVRVCVLCSLGGWILVNVAGPHNKAVSCVAADLSADMLSIVCLLSSLARSSLGSVLIRSRWNSTPSARPYRSRRPFVPAHPLLHPPQTNEKPPAALTFDFLLS